MHTATVEALKLTSSVVESTLSSELKSDVAFFSALLPFLGGFLTALAVKGRPLEVMISLHIGKKDIC